MTLRMNPDSVPDVTRDSKTRGPGLGQQSGCLVPRMSLCSLVHIDSTGAVSAL